ncbi:thioesterase family protein [Limibaculum sp. M0105]|uniref:Thioesterase family protein n=1 Tax=Thermohalobaculum xanthum TaxID=2753746 RepID=A0A8J7SHF9_9RHOB|nr:thioesterase family protein [Thermohalobaculum xanthum]MBK0399680.1 thioesterase family protein [Thermohalobaculum xanthum]
MTDTAPAAAAVRTARQQVEPGWIDYNGHMNVAYYTLAFDRALDDLYESLGIGPTSARRDRLGPMALQTQIHYLAELLEGEAFHCEVQILDADDKRVHVFATMIAEEDGRRVATYESLTINVDLEARRSAPFAPEAAARVRELAAAHAGLPRPEQAGRSIAIRRKG